MIYTFLVYIHIMCFHIMTQEEKNILVSIITVGCISFLLILIYSFYVYLLKIYECVHCMTSLGKLSCLQEAFIYIIVQTVSLKKKLHICHSWVIIDILFT
jgi:hypothetical protein